MFSPVIPTSKKKKKAHNSDGMIIDVIRGTARVLPKMSHSMVMEKIPWFSHEII